MNHVEPSLRFRFFATRVLALVGLVTAPLAAQEPDSKTPVAITDPMISVDFPGGTLSQFAASLRQAVSDSRARYAAPIRPVNIVLPPVAARVEVPAMQLREVTVDIAMNALEPLCAPKWRITPRTSVGAGSPIYTLRIETLAKPMIQPPIITSVLSLRNLITSPPRIADDPSSRLAADTILTAVEAGIKLGGDESNVKLAYHEGSALLFIRAPAGESQLAAEIIETLEQDLASRRRQLTEALPGKAGISPAQSPRNSAPQDPTSGGVRRR